MMKLKKGFNNTFNKYIKLCKLGNKYSYSKTLEIMNIKDPIKTNLIEEIKDIIINLLNDLENKL